MPIGNVPGKVALQILMQRSCIWQLAKVSHFYSNTPDGYKPRLLVNIQTYKSLAW